MPRPKGIVHRHKSGTGKNQGRKRTTPRDNRCFNRKESHSKRNCFSSPVIPVPPPLNDSVINPPRLSSVCQQSSRSSHNNPCDNRYFNFTGSHSKINKLSSPVLPVPPPLNDPVINIPQLSSVCQHSSRSTQNTTPESQASPIPCQTSDNPSNTMPPLSTNNGSRNIYGFMVDVSKLTPAKQQHYAVILLHNYHELCNTINPSSMFVSPPPIPNIESLYQSTISSLGSGSFVINRDDVNIRQQTTL